MEAQIAHSARLTLAQRRCRIRCYHQCQYPSTRSRRRFWKPAATSLAARRWRATTLCRPTAHACDTPEQPCRPLAIRPGISLAAVKSLAPAGLCLSLISANERRQVHQHRRRRRRRRRQGHVGAARHRHASPGGFSTRAAMHQTVAVCNASLDLDVANRVPLSLALAIAFAPSAYRLSGAAPCPPPTATAISPTAGPLWPNNAAC